MYLNNLVVVLLDFTYLDAMASSIQIAVCNVTDSVCECPSSHPVLKGQHCRKGKSSQLHACQVQQCCPGVMLGERCSFDDRCQFLERKSVCYQVL